MKLKLQILLGILCLGVGIYGVKQLVLGGPRSPLLGYRAEIQKAYDSIKPGDGFPEVRERLGAPIRNGDHLLLPQRAGFEKHFDEAERSNAKTYHLWINGGNWFYSIGFDADEKVVVKAEGHS